MCLCPLCPSLCVSVMCLCLILMSWFSPFSSHVPLLCLFCASLSVICVLPSPSCPLYVLHSCVCQFHYPVPLFSHCFSLPLSYFILTVLWSMFSVFSLASPVVPCSFVSAVFPMYFHFRRPTPVYIYCVSFPPTFFVAPALPLWFTCVPPVFWVLSCCLSFVQFRRSSV